MNARTRKRSFLTLGGVIAIGLLLFVLSGCLADMIDKKLNKVYELKDEPKASDLDKKRHGNLFIVDLHADTMLWNRDLLERADFGHVDLPRLIEGNVALQVFAMVTKTPNKNPAPADAMLIPEIRDDPDPKCIAHDTLNPTALLQVAQLRPIRTWFDLEERALHQAERLKGFVAESKKRHHKDASAPWLKLIENAADLEDLILRRSRGEPVVGALLALEGAHWIGEREPNIEAGIDRLFAAGFRMISPTHRFNNALSAASEGCNQLKGLTKAGKHFLAYAERKGMILDLAHASDDGISEAAGAAAGPIVVSHTGVRRTCDRKSGCDIERNMADPEIQAVARTGGVVAIGYWPGAVGRGMDNIVGGFASALRALSEQPFRDEMAEKGVTEYDPMAHIALGSDYDGSVLVPFDTSELVLLTAALKRSAAFDDEAVAKIAGANACRVFAERLPADDEQERERARIACDELVPAAP